MIPSVARFQNWQRITQRAQSSQSSLRKSGEERRRRKAAPTFEKKGGAQRDTLLIVSGCAPRRLVHCGEKVSGRNQRRGSAPGQIGSEGTALAVAPTLAEPGALRLPGLQKGSEKRERIRTILVRFSPLKSVSDLGSSLSGGVFGPPRKAGPTWRKRQRRLLLRSRVTDRVGG